LNFLVDHQLPVALARFISAQGHHAVHVRDIGLMEVEDTAIWQHAGRHGIVVISKDEDFTFLANRPLDTGRLVWVRLGNCRKKVLLEAFKAQLPNMVAEFDSGNRLVELR
jgi:predicted nuclease of predicted toxin-antitoxin system